MLTDEEFIEVIVVSINSLHRNNKIITVRNIEKLVNTFLKARFDGRNIRELSQSEQTQLCNLISRWKFYYKPTLIVDNTK